MRRFSVPPFCCPGRSLEKKKKKIFSRDDLMTVLIRFPQRSYPDRGVFVWTRAHNSCYITQTQEIRSPVFRLGDYSTDCVQTLRKKTRNFGSFSAVLNKSGLRAQQEKKFCHFLFFRFLNKLFFFLSETDILFLFRYFWLETILG